MRKLSINSIFLALFIVQSISYGQISIDTTQSADYLVNHILIGKGVLIGNVKFTGAKHAIGIYEDSASQVGFNKGILLTSGNAFYAIGPNKTPRAGWASNTLGDSELDKIARGKTYDASILEFDFVTMSENLSFKFVFASEEYEEYVGSKFNDVFGFFIRGPNEEKYNIARLPDNKTPITVNTVNNEFNAQYYIDNTYVNTTDPYIWDVRNRKVIPNKNYLQEEVPPKFNIQFDGFTTILEAHSKVVPNEVYHIKIAIADVGDGILDSGVFLKAGSFESHGQIVVEVDDHFKQKIDPVKVLRKERVFAEALELPKLKVPNRVSLANVEFEFDNYELDDAALSTVKRVYKEWVKNPGALIEIKGHTDNWGSHEYNIQLSQNRSKMVADTLIDLGIPKERLIVNFYGEKMPVHSNQTDYGRARNRRVEFVMIL